MATTTKAKRPTPTHKAAALVADAERQRDEARQQVRGLTTFLGGLVEDLETRAQLLDEEENAAELEFLEDLRERVRARMVHEEVTA